MRDLAFLLCITDRWFFGRTLTEGPRKGIGERWRRAGKGEGPVRTEQGGVAQMAFFCTYSVGVLAAAVPPQVTSKPLSWDEISP